MESFRNFRIVRLGALSMLGLAAFFTSARAEKPFPGGIKIPSTVRLQDLPIAARVIEKAGAELAQLDIDVSLVGGETWMLVDCVGLKLGLGKFRLRLGPPSARIDSTGVELDFAIDEFSLTALELQMEPRLPTWDHPNLCDWSDKFSRGCSVKASDVNDDGRVDVSDPLGLLGFLFIGGSPPPPPFPTAGDDPTGDDLPCAITL